MLTKGHSIQGGPRSKLSKNCQILLKSASEIRFVSQIKEMIKHYIILSVGIKYSLRDLLLASVTMPDL